MSLDSYANLKAEIALFLNKTNLTGNIPTFITLAEAKMGRVITSVGQVDNYADVAIDANGWPLPCRADQVASVVYDGSQLPYISPDRLDSVEGDLPGFYTIDGKTLKVSPVGTVTIRLKSGLCPLSASVSVNWVLREHPDAYLYGALMQAAPFLRDDERIGVWGGLFAAAINEINAREINRQVGPYLQMQSGPTP